MRPRFLATAALALVLPSVAVGHTGGSHVIQGDAAWRAFDSLSLLRSGSASVQARVPSCSPEARAAQLADAQRQVLQRLGREQPVDDPVTPDLTALDNESDLAALAALGYSVYSHQQVSFEDRGWAVGDAFGPPEDPFEAKPLAGRPSGLFYAPTPGIGTVDDWAGPRDGFDFPYRVAGWMYVFAFTAYRFGQHPIVGGDGQPFLTCLERGEWFVHERGVHPFEDGGMKAVPPAEEVHGTASGDSGPLPAFPADITHRRMWDLHVFLVEDSAVPVVQQGSPYPIPGREVSSLVGVSPPPNWPDPPYPASYYPPRAADLSLTAIDSPDPVHVGQTLTYTLTVANGGPDRATAVSLTISLPKHARSVSATPSEGRCSVGKRLVTCELGTLEGGSSTVVTVVLHPRGSGTVLSTASVSANETELRCVDRDDNGCVTWTTAGATDDNAATVTTEVLP